MLSKHFVSGLFIIATEIKLPTISHIRKYVSTFDSISW